MSSSPRPARPQLKRLLTEPATLILIAANAVPILGVLFLRWDAFLLLVLYWMETAVIGFWTMLLIAKLTDRVIGKHGEGQSRGAIVAVLTANAGGFMGVHFFFLWNLFAGAWKQKIGGVWDFIQVIVLDQGLWLALLILFVARGVEPCLLMFGPDWYRRKLTQGETPSPWLRGGLLFTLYARIVVMQFVIILSGFVVAFLGGAAAVAPLILLIAIKTAIDLGLFLHTDLGMDEAFEKAAEKLK